MTPYALLGLLKDKQARKPTNPKKILIVNLQGMGDLLMTTPLIHELAQHMRVDILINKRQQTILANNDSIHTTHHLASAQKTIRTINNTHYDLIYLAHGAGPKSALLFLLLKARYKASHRYRVGNRTTTLRADIILEPTPKMHRVNEHLKLLKALKIPIRKPTYHYQPDKTATEEAKKYYQQFGKKILIGIHPGGDLKNKQKRYPLKQYAAFTNALGSEYHTIIFLGPDERDLKQKAEHLFDHNKTNIYEGRLATVASILKRCATLIHSDSGLGHLAAAIGTPTATIVGPTNWHRTRPWGGKDHIIKDPDTPEPEERRMEQGNINPTRTICQHQITLKEVLP